MPTTQFALEFLLVSNSLPTVRTVKQAADELGIRLSTTRQEAALSYLSTHRLDGVILDAELRLGVPALINSLRQSSANSRAFIFVCANGDRETAQALKHGANAILRMPLVSKSVLAEIQAFRGIMRSERRRYFRRHVTIPILLLKEDIRQNGVIENLSQGGVAVLVNTPFNPEAQVNFSFELPFGPRITGTAQVAWSNSRGVMGLKFHVLPEGDRDHLVNWLGKHALTE